MSLIMNDYMNTILGLSMNCLAKMFLFKQPPFRAEKYVCRVWKLMQEKVY